ncbi:MAG TPA: hypothetical protein VME46_09250 [Acidimicrobiales bacterium]|nr:hypothetical protein [Acidimicrobiales bacterium]
MSTQDDVTLTAQERQQIAHMQAALQAADPTLARVLRRGQAPSRDRLRPVLRRRRRRLLADLSRGWVGPAATVAGLAVVVLTFVTLTWVSIVGAVAATAGMVLTGRALQRRWDMRSGRHPAGDLARHHGR